MNKNKNMFKLIQLFIPLTLSLFALAGVVFSVASAIVLNIDESSFFIDDSGKYKCYIIGDSADEKIAVAWNKTDTNVMPTDLVVPQTLSYTATVDGVGITTNYTVEAVAKGGFRYGKFSTIKLPTTIKAIKEEAFAYCQKMTYFEIPYQVDAIEASTFLDCRNLTTIYYTGSSGQRKLGNKVITSIGDHAFDSCINLKNFYCPSTVTNFGKSCFQKCSSLEKFLCPKKVEENHEITNPITIGAFAFADCSSLQYVYIEENVSSIGNHAFVDCNSSLEIRYTGTYTAPGLQFTNCWRNKYIATNYDNTQEANLVPVIYGSDRVSSDEDAPGMRFAIKSGPIYLQSGSLETPIDASTDQYAEIVEFEPPFDSQEGYFEIDENNKYTLILPDTLDGKPVKVIGESAFAASDPDTDPLKKVVFNSNLVQIKYKAFYKCLNIAELDFSNCENLKEISYGVFQDRAKRSGQIEFYNNQLREIALPGCLEYLGDYAFYNFTHIDGGISFTEGGPSHLKVIGDYCFAINPPNGNSVPQWSPASFDIILPKTLNDQDAKLAGYNNRSSHSAHVSSKPYAVGQHAFDNCRGAKSVVMEDDQAHKDDMSYTTSFGTDAFNRCYHIFYFRCNQNLYYIGGNTFKNCDDLLEVYLDSTKVNSIQGTYKYPWGINDAQNGHGESMFMGSNCKENVAIYVNGNAPRECDSLNTGTSNRWNVEACSSFEVNPNPGGEQYYYIRYQIPTFYNMNWYENSDVLYMNAKDNSFMNRRPATRNEYLYGTKVSNGEFVVDNSGQGVITFVKKSDGNFTLGHYYCDNSHKNVEIDLTNISHSGVNISSKLKHIGDEAFAANSNKAPGFYIVLPSTVESIGERAFYRKGVSASYGARIVTYKDANGYKAPSSLFGGKTYQQIRDECKSNSSTAGYCCLPPSVTDVGRCAFYNHKFKKVELNANLDFLGNSAFYSWSGDDKYLESISFNSGTDNGTFGIKNDCIYYVGGGTSHQILLSAPNNVTGTLTLDADTKAVGMHAVAGTQYTKIELNDGLKVLYGGAFASNKALVEVSGGTDDKGLKSLEYICAEITNSNTDSYYNSDAANHFDIIDYRSRSGSNALYTSRYGAFIECTSLTTLDFTKMTSLKKIGWGAFQNDTSLTKMAESQSAYVIKEYNAENDYTTLHNSKENVLDLRNSKDLVSITFKAFDGCANNIKFAMLPVTNETVQRDANHEIITPSKLYYGKNNNSSGPTGSPFSSGTKVLVGESVSQACAGYTRTSVTTYTNPSAHYPSTCYYEGSMYYYASCDEDCYSGKTTLHYWTLAANGDIILFSNYAKATAYLPAWSA